MLQVTVRKWQASKLNAFLKTAPTLLASTIYQKNNSHLKNLHKRNMLKKKSGITHLGLFPPLVTIQCFNLGYVTYTNHNTSANISGLNFSLNKSFKFLH